MPFPTSPFDEGFDLRLVTQLGGDSTDTTIQTGENFYVEDTLKWLCTCPKLTSFRVNSTKCRVEDALQRIRQKTLELNLPVNVSVHPRVDHVIIVDHLNTNGITLEKHPNEVLVDVDCAAAVLRGAHIFAPGVLSMLAGTKLHDKVSIYADIKKKCKKGLNKTFQGEKIFVGNGLVRMTRLELFGENLKPSGIGVEVTETLSGCPPLGDDYPKSFALLQNLPSIICVKNLNPQPNETVLDMCASPGNKTTHIAELMQNLGTLIAIDKTPKKVQVLRNRCSDFEAKVMVYQADSTKILGGNLASEGPPFKKLTFDRVLLDAPCSVLGKRPQIYNAITAKILRSYVPLQRKLFETGVALLKPGGVLVYSTCTITLAENEGVVAWALRTFPELSLIRPELCLGSAGWLGTDLTEEQRGNVQRFGPGQEVDSVGFFIACFVKKLSM